MSDELSFKDAIMTVKKALDTLSVTGLYSAGIRVSACADLETIANAVDSFVKSTVGGDKDDSAEDIDSNL